MMEGLSTRPLTGLSADPAGHGPPTAQRDQPPLERVLKPYGVAMLPATDLADRGDPGLSRADPAQLTRARAVTAPDTAGPAP
jgi:hypothetical protein